MGIALFQKKIFQLAAPLYRDLPWRNTHDPYAIWISEVMLQQTQVSRVDGRWQRWLMCFPNVQALAQAKTTEVLQEWQGLGYNRRALALKQAAERIVRDYAAELPATQDALEALPGIGPATAAGIVAFAYNKPAIYLETNVRAVYLYEFFPNAERVPDSALIPYIEETLPQDNVRAWYYALLDYGAELKKQHKNPARRSAHYAKQSRFDGSNRQKRANIVRILLGAQEELTYDAHEGVSQSLHQGAANIRSAIYPAALTTHEIAQQLSQHEQAAGRPPVSAKTVGDILVQLQKEGFCKSVPSHIHSHDDAYELSWVSI